MNGPGRPRRHLAGTFAVPGLLAVAGGLGLMVALAGEGMLDVVANAGIAAPLAAIAWAWLRARSRARHRPGDVPPVED